MKLSGKEDLHGSVTWKGWKIMDSDTRHSTATSKAWEVKGRRKKTWIDNVKEDLEKKMETLKQRWKWYETDGSGGISCCLVVSSADRREQRRRSDVETVPDKQANALRAFKDEYTSRCQAQTVRLAVASLQLAHSLASCPQFTALSFFLQFAKHYFQTDNDG